MLFIVAMHAIGKCIYMGKHACETGGFSDRLLCDLWRVSAAVALFLTLSLSHILLKVDMLGSSLSFAISDVAFVKSFCLQSACGEMTFCS